jgi:hypothetical protein
MNYEMTAVVTDSLTGRAKALEEARTTACFYQLIQRIALASPS